MRRKTSDVVSENREGRGRRGRVVGGGTLAKFEGGRPGVGDMRVDCGDLGRVVFGVSISLLCA